MSRKAKGSGFTRWCRINRRSGLSCKKEESQGTWIRTILCDLHLPRLWSNPLSSSGGQGWRRETLSRTSRGWIWGRLTCETTVALGHLDMDNTSAFSTFLLSVLNSVRVEQWRGLCTHWECQVLGEDGFPGELVWAFVPSSTEPSLMMHLMC